MGYLLLHGQSGTRLMEEFHRQLRPPVHFEEHRANIHRHPVPQSVVKKHRDPSALGVFEGCGNGAAAGAKLSSFFINMNKDVVGAFSAHHIRCGVSGYSLRLGVPEHDPALGIEDVNPLTHRLQDGLEVVRQESIGHSALHFILQ